MNKKAIDKFITNLEGQTFSDHNGLVDYLRIYISDLVEEIYKEELAISDKRWKEAEEKLKKYE